MQALPQVSDSSLIPRLAQIKIRVASQRAKLSLVSSSKQRKQKANTNKNNEHC